MRLWIQEVRDFVKKSQFRKELFLDQNIGPDLVLYLFNLMEEKEEIYFCNSTVAQLSYHKDSMSILYGKVPLSTGYWLARIWYLERYLLKNKNLGLNKIFLGKISAYIISSGVLVLSLNLLSLRFSYAFSTIKEVLRVIFKTIRLGFAVRVILSIPSIIINRISRDKGFLTPD